MADRNDDEDKRGFLKRWSRLKSEEAGRPTPEAAPPATKAPPAIKAPREIAGTGAPVETETASLSDADAAVPFDPADLPDIDSLDKDSDYTGFLKDGVPAELRRLALRKLWRSDPALAVLDGLNDYDEDFTLAKVAEKIVSSYKPGRGYVDEEEDEVGDELAELEEIEEGDIADVNIADGDIADGEEEKTEIADAEKNKKRKIKGPAKRKT